VPRVAHNRRIYGRAVELNFKRVMARKAIEQRARSAYGPKQTHLDASATGPNKAVFEQDKSASPESAQAE
jgi:hypothetical protein